MHTYIACAADRKAGFMQVLKGCACQDGLLIKCRKDLSMNKKEIAEIRKQFSPENCAITRISGCYVDSEKNKKTSMKEAFLSLPEEEMFKYLDIFKKTLSGHIGKNLMNLEYSIAQEAAGTPHAFLTEIRATKLQDDELIHEFYNKIIENYILSEPYYIVLIHGIYDIPGRSSDKTKLFDASDDVYEFIMSSICPVKLTKAGLSYDAEANRVENRIRDWLVDAPAHGFLFPAFNDRATDLHGCLYYSKKTDSLQDDFVKDVIGAQTCMSAEVQKDAFNQVLEEMIGNSGSVEELLEVHEKLQEELLGSEFTSAEPLELDKEKVRGMLADIWNDPWDEYVGDRMENFDTVWDSIVGEKTSLLAENVAARKSLNIECGNATVKIDPFYANKIREKTIDGVRCLVIPSDGFLKIDDVQLCGKVGAESHE